MPWWGSLEAKYFFAFFREIPIGNGDPSFMQCAVFYYKIRPHLAHFSGHEDSSCHLPWHLDFFPVNSIGIKTCMRIYIYIYFFYLSIFKQIYIYIEIDIFIHIRQSNMPRLFRFYMSMHVHIQRTCRMSNDLNSESGGIRHTIWKYFGYHLFIHD